MEVHLDLLDIAKIIDMEVMFLESEPTLEEVNCTMWACGTYNSPRYNEFNLKIFKEMWK